MVRQWAPWVIRRRKTEPPPPPSSLHGRTLLLPGALCSRLLLPAAPDLSVIHFLHHKQSFSSELEFLAQHLPGYYLKTKLLVVGLTIWTKNRFLLVLLLQACQGKKTASFLKVRTDSILYWSVITPSSTVNPRQYRAWPPPLRGTTWRDLNTRVPNRRAAVRWWVAEGLRAAAKPVKRNSRKLFLTGNVVFRICECYTSNERLGSELSLSKKKVEIMFL